MIHIFNAVSSFFFFKALERGTFRVSDCPLLTYTCKPAFHSNSISHLFHMCVHSYHFIAIFLSLLRYLIVIIHIKISNPDLNGTERWPEELNKTKPVSKQNERLGQRSQLVSLTLADSFQSSKSQLPWLQNKRSHIATLGLQFYFCGGSLGCR